MPNTFKLAGHVFDNTGAAVGATIQRYEVATTTTFGSSTTANTSTGKYAFTDGENGYDIKITYGSNVRWLKGLDELNVSELAIIQSTEAGAANLYLATDQADDAGDSWRIQAGTSDTLAIANNKNATNTFVDQFTLTNHATTTSTLLTLTGGLTAGGLITANGGITFAAGDDIAFTGTTGTNDITLTDSLADALSITRGGTDMVVFNSSTPSITFAPVTTFTGAITASGGVAGALTGNADTATLATNITATANNSTDETVYPTFLDGATGTQGIETDTGLTYNPSTGVLTSTTFTGALSGNATTSTEATNITTSANNSTDETVYPTFVDGATGTQGIETDTGLTYNPSSGILTSTNFTGALTGNADTVTTNANLTGHVTSSGNAAILGSFTSAQLAGALTNETGSGLAVFGTSPTLVTPALGTPASGVMTNVSGTASSLTAGTATTATTATNVTASANNTTDETVYPTFVDGATGGQGIETDTGLTYNPSSGILASTAVLVPAASSVADDGIATTKGSGLIATMRALTGIGIGELVHIDANGDLDQAHADATLDMPSIGIALTANASGSDANIQVLLQGFYRDDTQFGFTPGLAVYVDHGTEGDFQQTPSTTDGHFIQRIGIAVTDDMIYFNPSMDVIERD